MLAVVNTIVDGQKNDAEESTPFEISHLAAVKLFDNSNHNNDTSDTRQRGH